MNYYMIRGPDGRVFQVQADSDASALAIARQALASMYGATDLANMQASDIIGFGRVPFTTGPSGTASDAPQALNFQPGTGSGGQPPVITDPPKKADPLAGAPPIDPNEGNIDAQYRRALGGAGIGQGNILNNYLLSQGNTAGSLYNVGLSLRPPVGPSMGVESPPTFQQWVTGMGPGRGFGQGLTNEAVGLWRTLLGKMQGFDANDPMAGGEYGRYFTDALGLGQTPGDAAARSELVDLARQAARARYGILANRAIPGEEELSARFASQPVGGPGTEQNFFRFLQRYVGAF